MKIVSLMIPEGHTIIRSNYINNKEGEKDS